MLAQEVVDAVSAGRFHVWAVRTVDEALLLLGGVRAGTRRKDGTFAPDTVHARVAARLADYGESLRAEREGSESPREKALGEAL
jgi:hypothetical protein